MSDRSPGDFGTRLREARERRGITLRELANATKISVRALEALERGQISRLPGGIFSRAFVRAYAGAVGLDPEAAIRDFIDAFPQDSVTAGHPSVRPVEDIEAVESDRRAASAFLRVGIISIVILGGIAYFAASRGSSNGTRSVPPAPTAPAVAQKPAALDTAATVPHDTPVAPAADAPPVQGGTSGVDVRSTPAPPPETAKGQAGVLTVGLTASRDCWVAATVDGQRALARVFRAGEQRSVDVQRDLTLTIGDAGALQVTFNGADARPLGRPGEVVTLHFNPTNFRDYLASR